MLQVVVGRGRDERGRRPLLLRLLHLAHILPEGRRQGNIAEKTHNHTFLCQMREAILKKKNKIKFMYVSMPNSIGDVIL